MKLKVLTASVKASRAGSRHLANDSLAQYSARRWKLVEGLLVVLLRCIPLWLSLQGHPEFSKSFSDGRASKYLGTIMPVRYNRNLLNQYDKAAEGSEPDRGGMIA